MRVWSSLFALGLAALPTAAFAHAGVGSHDLAHGLMHPVGGLDHVLAILAVGTLAFVLAGRALWLVPLSFVGMMAAGFVLGANGVVLPHAELAIGLSSVVIGGLAAIGRRVPLAVALALVGGFAAFHGWAHGAEMPVEAGTVPYALGFMAITAMLHVTAIAAAKGVAAMTGQYGRQIVRIVGGIFAIGGTGILAGWL